MMWPGLPQPSVLRSRLVWLPIVAMLGLLGLRSMGETHRLLLDWGEHGAIDLRFFMELTRAWTAGEPVYGVIETGVFPPAWHLLVWPIYGWLGPVGTRVWYLALAISSLVVLGWLVHRATRHAAMPIPLLALLLPLAGYAAWATIGNGQLTLFLLAILLAVVLRVQRAPGQAWGPEDLLLGAGLVFTLAKPHFAAPFLCLLLWSPRGRRLLGVALLGQLAISLVAASFQHASLVTLVTEWVRVAEALAVRSATEGSFANLHTWLVLAGRERWIAPATVVVFLCFLLWSWRAQGAGLWVQLGAAGVFSRLLAYHRIYDDLLILPALVALLRLALEAPPSPRRTVAEALFWAGWVSAMGPAQWHADPLLAGPYASVQGTIWLGMLGFLMWEGRRGRPEHPAQ